MSITVDDLYMALGRLLAENISFQKRIVELESKQEQIEVPTDWGPTPKEQKSE